MGDRGQAGAARARARIATVAGGEGPLLDVGREVCGDLLTAEPREWLCANGIGGFASGTVAGLLTRRYHGLLVAALKAPVGRTLMVAKVDETVTYGGARWPLGVDRWADGTLGPHGYRLIERFRLDGTTPVWTYALWYNALRAMTSFARVAGQPGTTWDEMASRAAAGFERFWNEARDACYDVIDGPGGSDATLRPNQILAVSLPASPLSPERQRRVVATCGRHLLTSFGLRSLAPGESAYRAHYGGGPAERDGGYHQGPAWGWLLGPFALAHFRVHGDRDAARSYLLPMAHHLAEYGLGSIAEIFDGDAPFSPRGAIAQAWSVAETLRAWVEIGAAPARATGASA